MHNLIYLYFNYTCEQAFNTAFNNKSQLQSKTMDGQTKGPGSTDQKPGSLW